MSKEIVEGGSFSHQEEDAKWFSEKNKEEVGAERAAYYTEQKLHALDIPDPESRYREFIDLGNEELLSGLDPVKSFEEAKSAAREIKSIDTREKALGSIVEGEARAGLFPAAKKTAGSMGPTFYRDRAFGRIAVREAESRGVADYEALDSIARKSGGRG